MLRFASETTATVNAGEAILLKYRDSDYTGNYRLMTGRQFALAVWDNSSEYVDLVATVATDATSDYAQWVLDGTTSQALRGKTGLFFELAEQLNNSRETITSGILTVVSTAPVIATNSAAPVARWIACLTRLYDPVLHSVTPTFHITYESYGPSTSTTTTNVSTDFSDLNHTLMLTIA